MNNVLKPEYCKGCPYELMNEWRCIHYPSCSMWANRVRKADALGYRSSIQDMIMEREEAAQEGDGDIK